MAGFWNIYEKTLMIRHKGEGQLTADHKVARSMFERLKQFEAKCGRKELSWFMH